MQVTNLIRLFIASPSDVEKERDAAVRVSMNWNNAHSLAHGMTIEVVQTATHSTSRLGDHPQRLINRELLDRCDFLVAVFWSKLGTETPDAESGTVDEIRQFSKLKGPENVLLFFCDRPVKYPPSGHVDTTERDRLQRFKNEIKTAGIYIPFTSTKDFQEKLQHQIDMRMDQYRVPAFNLLSRDLLLPAYWGADGAGARIEEYRSLRSQAGRSLYVMGIGMTMFSADVSLLRSLVMKGISVRLLMMDPQVISSPSGNEPMRMRVDDKTFSAYFDRHGYASDLATSLSRLQEHIRGFAGKGNVELRTYDTILPVNFTAIDVDGPGKLLLEFCMPFSDQRCRTLLTKNGNGPLFAEVVRIGEKLWDQAKPKATATTS